MPYDEIEEKIVQMGGKLVDKIHNKLTAVISNDDEVEKMNLKMITVEQYGIHVVSEDILDQLKMKHVTDPALFIELNDISGWGKNVIFF